MINFALVSLGGAVGACLRYGVTLASAAAFGGGFPIGVFAANVLGSGLMGVAAVICADRASPEALLVMTGLLGGFTTFSAFSLDAVGLWTSGREAAAMGYVMGSVLLSFGALAGGAALGRFFS